MNGFGFRKRTQIVLAVWIISILRELWEPSERENYFLKCKQIIASHIPLIWRNIGQEIEIRLEIDKMLCCLLNQEKKSLSKYLKANSASNVGTYIQIGIQAPLLSWKKPNNQTLCESRWLK